MHAAEGGVRKGERQGGSDYNEVYLYSKMSIDVISSEGHVAMADILEW